MKKFLEHWSIVDVNKAFAFDNCYNNANFLWDEHLDLSYITYVTYDDIGMNLGDSAFLVTKEICDEKTHIKISELGKEILMMDKL